MYDGSALPFDQNIARTAEVVAMAHARGVSVEGELGFVGYDGGAQGIGTNPSQVRRFWAETGLDALAVSVGNNHLMTTPGVSVDIERLRAIQQQAPRLPLVLHGGSGIAADLRRRLAAETSVCKFNVGTELRMAFGAALRSVLAGDAAMFDRTQILSGTTEPVASAARLVIRSMAG